MDDDASSSTSSSTSFVVLSVSIVGILATALLLLSYYLFVTRCGLLFFWRSSRHLHPTTVEAQAPPQTHERRGLQPAAIRRLPTFRYQGRQGRRRRSNDDDGNQLEKSDCAVCLADFRDGERLRLLPPCRHAFHIDCIDTWLQATANCPLCRAATVVVSVIPDDDQTGCLAAACHHDTAVIDISSSSEEESSPSPAPAEEDQQQPTRTRRSLSMDSSTVYLALHRMMLHHQHKDHHQQQAEDTKSPRAAYRSFFSFSHSRSATILPL